MSEYVPTTDDIRNSYIITPEDNEAFDRWLASVKAEVWDEGGAVVERYYIGDGPEPVNPYREEPAE